MSQLCLLELIERIAQSGKEDETQDSDLLIC